MADRKKHWNIGLVVFFVLLLYVMINVVMYLGKHKLSVYKVTEDKITNTMSFTGIAFRDEKLLSAPAKGYVTYCMQEGKRIQKASTAFLLDEKGSMRSTLASKLNQSAKKKQNDDRVKQEISDYRSLYSDDDFGEVYNLKTNLENSVLNLNESKLNQIVGSIKNKNSIIKKKSPCSGVVSFYSDDFDNKSIYNVTEDDFDKDQYRAVRYVSSDQVAKGKVIMRITKDETWRIVVPLTEDQYEKLRRYKEVSIKFAKDQITTDAQVSAKEKDGDFFAYLTLNDYGVRYIDDRYLDIDLILDSYAGLKIPNSAIVEKSFYQVPLDYISKGNNSSEEGFSVVDKSEKETKSVEQKEYTIYKKDSKYCYLDPDEVEQGTVLTSTKNGGTFVIGKKKELSGVYCTNQGYADFKLIDIIIRKKEFSIIDDSAAGSIQLYDYIVLDQDAVKENQIIY